MNKHHRPTVHITPTGTIRQCGDCLQSWELVREKDGSEWRPIHETDERGRIALARNIEVCQGEFEVIAQERSTKATSAGSSGGSTRGNDLCYCKECNGKSKHFPEARNCYCRSCGGKRQHNG
jgi:hypothetical protein